MARKLHSRGHVISRWNVWKILPLRVEDIQLKNVPHYRDPLLESPSSSALLLATPDEEKVMAKLLHSRSDWKSDVLRVSLRLVLNNQQDELLDRRGGNFERDEGDDRTADDEIDDAEFGRQLHRVWKVVANRLSWERWTHLLRLVGATLHVIESPHPLHRFAAQQLPHLSESERRQVAQLVLPQLSPVGDPASSSPGVLLALMKHCQECVPPRRVGVLLLEALDRQCAQSCVPTAQLELTESGRRLQVVALYDILLDSDEEKVSLCYVNVDDSVEQREAAVQDRTGRCCGCLRCRYEVDPRRAMANLSSREAVRLANYYLSKLQLEAAEELYTKALETMPDQADAWHALGAIRLSQGRFLEAQRVWSAAFERFPASCRQHPGLSLQLEKLKGYRYLEQREPLPTSSSNVISKCIVPNAHVAPMLSPATCQRILEWAQAGTWTRQRHYAVPTYDVPVHTVGPLREWFDEWFHHSMRPLLARQFQTSPNYFVHDAFCVRYLADDDVGANYLPIHTDESTHSFVVALNDCHDYEGGGTYFADHDHLVRLPIGHVLSFRGDRLPHGGEAVTRNVRHILVAFLYHDDDDDDDDDRRDGSNRQVASKKRRQTELSQAISHAKSQKTGFSFEFQVGNDAALDSPFR